MTTDPAVTAAAEALIYRGASRPDTASYRYDASVAVAAARPIIEAEVRERIAADIEFLRLGCRDGETARLDALDAAARIARGQS